ncbi:MAG: hypothetical protein GXP42_09050 [Chloroflexi bacterium]|nr:hypothetical protein [Chloroflexota bacterium]
MKRFLALNLFAFALLALSACGGRSADIVGAVQPTIDAAVAATVTAQVAMQGAIDAAVAATVEAQNVSDAADLAPTATPAPTSTPIPAATASVEYVTLTEEELAALIDEAVSEAVTASENAADAADNATDDGDVNADEVETIEVYVHLSEETIAYAEALIDAYQEQYGDVADEFLAVLMAIEEDLAELAQNTAAIAQSLDEISRALEQGLALAEESVAQLEDAAAQTTATVEQLQQQAQAWQRAMLVQLQQRDAAQSQASAPSEDALSLFQPTEVASDPAAALRSAWAYANMAQNALADGVISPDELNAIAQAGVNASAGLKAHGGPGMQDAAAQIEQLTRQLADGQFDQALRSLQQLQAGLPSLPAGSGAPGRGKRGK